MAGKGGVHISYLVVAIVICLGLVGFIVAQNSELAQVRANLSKREQTIDDQDKSIREYVTEQEIARDTLIATSDSKPDYTGMKEWIQMAGGEMAKAEGATDKAATEYLCVQDYLQDSIKVIQHWRTRFEQQKAAADNKDSEYQAILGQKEELRGQRDGEIAQLNSRINELQEEKERVQAEARKTEEDLREQVEAKEDEMAAGISSLQRQLYVEQNLHNKTKRRLEILQDEIRVAQTFDKVDPDGELVQVSDDLGFAWIDIGQDDRVKRGTVFDVFSYIKGGKRLAKGKVEVVSVLEDMAKVSITSVFDEFNPLLPGDKIASPFYNKEEVPSFVIAGEELNSRQLSLEELGRKISKYGGTVEDRVRLETSYVVAVNGYEVSAAYKEARELGITIIREDELLGFLGY